MRFFCTGKVVEWDQPLFEPLIGKMGMEKIQGARAVILLDVFKVKKPEKNKKKPFLLLCIYIYI